MASNHLILNPTKTEFLSLGIPKMKHLINQATFMVDGVGIAPNSVILILNVLVDEVLSFDNHIGHIKRNCHYQLQRIKIILR